MLEPVVRLMVACEDARRRKGTNKFDILGLITIVNAPAHAFPINLSFSVFLCLTDGHGLGTGWISVINDGTDEVVLDGEPVEYDFGKDLTSLLASVISIPICTFPEPGLYRIAFVYNDREIASYLVHVRSQS